ncbi:MAG: hypothetical protein JST59_01465 [Actinobacteria bacterium]|nr:hypothetical protein [Actinomycetota bacterium]
MKEVSDLARRQSCARFEELEQILKELRIRKSQEEMDLLASEIYEGKFGEEGKFVVNTLMEFLQRSLRQEICVEQL